MTATTVKIQQETKTSLDQFREYKNESYDEVINKLVFIARNIDKKPELSKETIQTIQAARKRYEKGQFISETEAKKRLGLTTHV